MCLALLRVTLRGVSPFEVKCSLDTPCGSCSMFIGGRIYKSGKFHPPHSTFSPGGPHQRHHFSDIETGIVRGVAVCSWYWSPFSKLMASVSVMSRVFHLENPYTPCMDYMPTLTSQTTPMWAYMAYMEPLGMVFTGRMSIWSVQGRSGRVTQLKGLEHLSIS